MRATGRRVYLFSQLQVAARNRRDDPARLHKLILLQLVHQKLSAPAFPIGSVRLEVRGAAGQHREQGTEERVRRQAKGGARTSSTNDRSEVGKPRMMPMKARSRRIAALRGLSSSTTLGPARWAQNEAGGGEKGAGTHCHAGPQRQRARGGGVVVVRRGIEGRDITCRLGHWNLRLGALLACHKIPHNLRGANLL